MNAQQSTRLNISHLTSLPELRALRDDWQRLEESCPDITPFSTWEWCDAAARYRANGHSLRIYTFREGEDLRGVAPFLEAFAGGLRILRLLGAGGGRYSIADYQDLPFADGCQDKVVAAFCDALAQHGSWDMLHLQELPADSRAVSLLTTAAAARGWQTSLRSGSDVHVLPVSGSWEDYKATLSRSTRNDGGRQARKLVAEHSASFATVNGDDEEVAKKAMEDLFDLHTQRWQSVGLPGIFRDERRRDFHRAVSRRFARRGMLALHVIRSEEGTIAAKYGFQKDGIRYYYTNGFDPHERWRRFRLGLVLDLELIREAFEQGARCVDFMRGESHYKDHYRMDTRLNKELFIFRDRRAQLQYRLVEGARSALGRLRRKLTASRAAAPASE